jgi:CHAT domain-containing protein
LARTYAAARNQTLARSFFEKAIQVVDKNRTGLSRDDYKVTFLASLIRFYRDYVEFLMQNGDAAKALEVVESSRARILAETVAQPKPARPISGAALQQAAKRSGRVFLSYWLAPVQSYVWVISSKEIKHFPLGPSAPIESLVNASRDGIQEWDVTVKESPDARRLYGLVLGPVAAHIPMQAHVVIVPDGALHYLNFETLPVYGEKPPHYWIEDATVAVAPSLAIAADAPLPQPIRRESLLIMGDALAAGPEYAKLPNAPKEMERVGNHFASAKRTIVRGAEATPASYLQSRPEQFSVIHFSAHGEANSQSPLDSAIILSPQGGIFKLYARDVIGLRLAADLVTISACRSAGARVYSGEGLVGFAWAFLKAGAHYVVAGLWDVTDRSTPDMMDKFYGAMQAGQNPPDALRAAKLSMVHATTAFRKPYYWGPFQIYIR